LPTLGGVSVGEIGSSYSGHPRRRASWWPRADRHYRRARRL